MCNKCNFIPRENSKEKETGLICDYPGCGLGINGEKVFYDRVTKKIYHFEEKCEAESPLAELKSNVFDFSRMEVISKESALTLFETGNSKKSKSIEGKTK